MLRTKIYIASDHAGFGLKKQLCEYLIQNNLSFIDLGCEDETSCDYAYFAHKLCKSFDHEKDFGVLICGSGIGISIAANRHKNVRAALCNEALSARLAREHNDANVLVLAGRLLGDVAAKELIKVFINTPFAKGRHAKRIALIEEIK